MAFEKPPFEGKDRAQAENREQTEAGISKEKIARAAAATAWRVNTRLTEAVASLQRGELTPMGLERVASDLETFVFRDICDLLGIEESVRAEALDIADKDGEQ